MIMASHCEVIQLAIPQCVVEPVAEQKALEAGGHVGWCSEDGCTR